MADKAKELEERLDRLENRLKTTFLEVEKRFEEIRDGNTPKAGAEDRVAELEDLLLLLQLEVSKIKESSGSGLEFGATAEPQSDIIERLKKVEDFLASHEAVDEAADVKGVANAKGAAERLALLERRVAAMEIRAGSDKGMSSMGAELDTIEKRLERLEEGRALHSLPRRTEHKPVHKTEHRPLRKHSKEVSEEKEKIRREQDRLQEKIMQRKSVLEDVRKILQSS